MDGFGKTLYWFQEEDLIIEVPFFQRPYVWDSDNWNSLIESIENAKEKTMPFIGSFILQERKDNSKVFWVIDGQQRITTLTILIKCLIDTNKALHPITKLNLEGMVYKPQTIDSETYIYKTRLTPSNADKESYEKVMNHDLNIDDLHKGESKIVDCYLHFRDYLLGLNGDQLKSLTDKFLTTSKYVIIIQLNIADDEQKIFDTVNSLGKRLTNSDIVKNYLYQKMKYYAGDNPILIDKVIAHHDKYWGKVFIDGDRRDFWDERITLGRIATTNLDSFLKDYGTIKGIYIPSNTGGFDGLAKKYKEHIDKLTESELEQLSIEISEYANIYYMMKMKYLECDDFRMSDVLNTTLLILNKFDITTFNPYILNLVKKHEPDMNEKLFDLQRFVLKRFLWKATIKNYNNVCLSLLSAPNPKEVLDNYNAQSADVDWDSYPLGVKTISNKAGNLLLFIIEMIRRQYNGEDKYIDSMVYKLSLEHIMPQQWDKNWKDVPSYVFNDKGEYELLTEPSDIEKNRKSKIYSLGNMSLLTSNLNTSISNGTFKDKIEGSLKHKGIKAFVGTLSITQEIVEVYEKTKIWDERNITEREIKLVNELNDYYKFVGEIGKKDMADVKVIDITYFNDEFFNKKVGFIAQVAFKYLIVNDMLTEEDYMNLNDKTYCSKNTGCALAVLVYKESDTYDSLGRRRYYADPIKGAREAFLSNEWYESDKKYLIPWLKIKLGLEQNSIKI